MARFMVSMPDQLLRELDRRAKEEHRTRSELLREAVRRLSAAPLDTMEGAAASLKGRMQGKQKQGKWTRTKLEQVLAAEGVRKGCPGIGTLVGPAKGPVDMDRVLEIGKKLAGLTRDAIEAREERL